MAAAPALARLGTHVPLGLFFGFDFHLAEGQLALIELNTNADGAMFNALLARDQPACCLGLDAMVPTLADVAVFEERIVEMFRNQWRRSASDRP